MYGSGNTEPPVEKAGKKARLGDHFATSGKADANTPSQDAAKPSSLNSSARPRAERDASTASIKSGVLGHGSEEPRLQQETTKTSEPTDSFRDPTTHPTRSKLEDQPWHGKRRVDPGPTQTRGGDTAAIGQTSTYRSYPLATGEKTSPVLERESSESASHQHSEQTGAPAGREDAGLEAKQRGADYTGNRHVEKNANISDRSFKGAAGISARDGTRAGPGDSTLTHQYTKTESDNPYSASRLDPRVDPHTKTSDAGSASTVTGAFATSATQPADRLDGAHGSSADNRGLSGAKETAEHFDGPQDMSQSSQAQSALQPSNEALDTSRPTKEADQCETLVSTMPGAFHYGGIVVASSYHDPVPQDKASYYDFGSSLDGPSTKELTQKLTQEHKENVATSDGLKASSQPLQGEGQAQSTSSAGLAGLKHQKKSAEIRNDEPTPESEGSQDGVGKSQYVVNTGEPPEAATGGLEPSDAFAPSENGHKVRNAGFLGAAAGALGLGGHVIKKHAEDKPKRPAATSRRESIPTTTYPPGTAPGDRRYPEAGVGGFAAASSRSPDTVAAPSAEVPSQSSATKSPSGTSPADRPYSQVSEEHFPAVGSGVQDSKIAPYTGASSQPATMKYVTDLEPTTATGSMHDAPTSTPTFTGTRMADECHIGRNTAIGGAAVAGAGVLGTHEVSKHQAEKPTTGTSAYTAAERPDDRHSARDAAIDSTPTAATGAHEYSRRHAEQPSTSTSASTAMDRPGDRRFGRDTPIGGMATAGAIAHDDRRHQAEKPTSDISASSAMDRPEDHHMSRNMAVGGLAVAGAGAGGTPEHSQYQAEKSLTEEPHSKAREKPEDSHLGRNAAIGGAAAFGAAAVGGHEYSLRQTEREGHESLEAEKAQQKAVEESRRAAEKEQKAHEKALDKEEKKADQAHVKALHKEEKKAEKEHEKAAKKEEREHEKAMHKEEKKAEKEHEKAIKKEQKEHEKAVKMEEKEHEREHMMAVKMEEKKEKEHEKELAKQERQEEKQSSSEEKDKKKHGLLGLFHRKRDSQDNEAEHGEDDPHSGVKTTGGTEAADTAGTENQEHEKRHILGLPHREVKNKLHKDPPPGLYSGDPTTPAYADHPVKQDEHPDAHTATGRHTAAIAPETERNKYAEASGAAVDTPGTGTGTTPTLHAPPAGLSAQNQNGAGVGTTTHREPHPATSTRPRGPSAAKYGDLPQGYASQAYATDTGPSAASGRDINLHSDGRRYYADGRPVDDDAAGFDGSATQQQQQGSEGGAGRKVLEKLHLRKASR